VPSDAGADPFPPGPAPELASGWRIPFWALQVLEFGVAFLLVTQSVHVGHGGILVAAAAALTVLGLTADGHLGIFRVCGQRLHVLLVVGVAVAMVVAACFPAARPDLEGLLVIAFAVVALVALAGRTAVSRRPRRRTGEIIEATATVTGPVQEPAEPINTSAGSDVDPDPGVDSAIRKAGRTTGAAAAAGKRAVDEHRPAVEHQVKKGLRGAGRLAGRLTGPKSPPNGPA